MASPFKGLLEKILLLDLHNPQHNLLATKIFLERTCDVALSKTCKSATLVAKTNIDVSCHWEPGKKHWPGKSMICSNTMYNTGTVERGKGGRAGSRGSGNAIKVQARVCSCTMVRGAVLLTSHFRAQVRAALHKFLRQHDYKQLANEWHPKISYNYSVAGPVATAYLGINIYTCIHIPCGSTWHCLGNKMMIPAA